MAAGCFLDTNILLYAISTTTAERAKRSLARYLLQDDDWTLSIQVLQEFYVQATRPSRPDNLMPSEAVELIRCWRRFTVQPINETVLDQALELHSNHPFLLGCGHHRRRPHIGLQPCALRRHGRWPVLRQRHGQESLCGARLTVVAPFIQPCSSRAAHLIVAVQHGRFDIAKHAGQKSRPQEFPCMNGNHLQNGDEPLARNSRIPRHTSTDTR